MMMMDEKSFLQSCQDFFPELRVLPQDLKNPTPEFTIGFFKRFLAELEIDLPSLQQMTPTQMSRLSNIEMFQDLIPTLNLSKAVNFIFSQIGLDKLNFGLSDLVAPTPKRNMLIMFNTMNFLLFCDDRAAAFDPKFKEFLKLKSEYKEAVKRRNELKETVNQQATERAHRQKQREELLTQKSRTEKMLQELHLENEDLTCQRKQLKNQLKADEESLEKASYRLKNLQEELESLKSQIVSSPEELNDQYLKLVEQRNEAKEKADNLLKQIQPKKETMKKLNAFIEAHEIRMDMLKEIIELNQIVENYKAEKTALSKKTSSAEESSEDAHVQLNQLQKKFKQTQETLEKLQAEWNQQNSILNTNQETLKMELAEAQNKFDEASEEKKILQENVDEASQELSELEKKFYKRLAESNQLKIAWENIQDAAFKNYEERIAELEKLAKKL